MREIPLYLYLVLLVACGDDDGTTDAAVDSSLEDRRDGNASDGRDDALPDAMPDSMSMSDADAMSMMDAEPPQPGCEDLQSNGTFTSCDACDSTGRGCDEIDAPSGSGNVCDCEMDSDCPCGLHCGSIMIGPGINVSDVCVR